MPVLDYHCVLRWGSFIYIFAILHECMIIFFLMLDLWMYVFVNIIYLSFSLSLSLSFGWGWYLSLYVFSLCDIFILNVVIMGYILLKTWFAEGSWLAYMENRIEFCGIVLHGNFVSMEKEKHWGGGIGGILNFIENKKIKLHINKWVVQNQASTIHEWVFHYLLCL